MRNYNTLTVPQNAESPISEDLNFISNPLLSVKSCMRPNTCSVFICYSKSRPEFFMLLISA